MVLNSKNILLILLLYITCGSCSIEEPSTNVLENKIQSLLKNYKSTGYELQMGQKYETRHILENKVVESTTALYLKDDGYIKGLETKDEVTECPKSEKCCKVYSYNKTSKKFGDSTEACLMELDQNCVGVITPSSTVIYFECLNQKNKHKPKQQSTTNSNIAKPRSQTTEKLTFTNGRK